MNSETNYISILKNEFSRRVQINPAYSQRAFARDLNISPSSFSEIMSGKYGLSSKKANSIASRLGYNAEERDYFCNLVDSVHARSPIKRKMARIKLETMKLSSKDTYLKDEAFKVISDWYHFAILELTYLEGFKSDFEWISRTLGIHKVEAELAVERLMRLNLLGATEKGSFYAIEESTFSTDGVPSEAIRKFHVQVLEKAQRAIDFQGVDKRDYITTTMCVDKAKVPEAKRMIRQFRREFNRIIGSSEKKDSVHCLAIQFFSLLEDDVEN